MTIELLIKKPEKIESPQEAFREITEAIAENEVYRNRCLNLIASENSMSPATRRALSSDLGNRYTICNSNGERMFPGAEKYDPIEAHANRLIRKLLHVPNNGFVSVQPTSGMCANLVAYHSLIYPGDLVLSVREYHGGHYSHEKGRVELLSKSNGKVNISHPKAEKMLDLFGAIVEYLPFDDNKYQLDLDLTKDMIRNKKPKLIIVGASEMLFPIPLKELRPVCDETGTKILYDAAHVSGLILGGTFQQPLLEGADMVTSSTNKTMGGPDHGFVASSQEFIPDGRGITYRDMIRQGLKPMFTSNQHAHHIAGVAVTLAELDEWGNAYATQVIKNAKALGKSLDENGIKVVASDFGYTESHTILVDLEKPANETVKNLAKANIILNTTELPSGIPGKGEERGLRIGTNEMTRMGMNEKEMVQIAIYISEVLLKRRTPEEVRIDVEEFRLKFQTQKYCFPL